MRHVVGVDLGGTNIVVGTVAEDGSSLLGLVSRPTPVEQGADGVVDAIVEQVCQSIAAAKQELARAPLDVTGVGIGAPGPLHTRQGIVRFAPNLGWHDMPLRDRVAKAVR